MQKVFKCVFFFEYYTDCWNIILYDHGIFNNLRFLNHVKKFFCPIIEDHIKSKYLSEYLNYFCAKKNLQVANSLQNI